MPSHPSSRTTTSSLLLFPNRPKAEDELVLLVVGGASTAPRAKSKRAWGGTGVTSRTNMRVVFTRSKYTKCCAPSLASGT